MTPGFFDAVLPDGAGCTGRTVKPSGFATAKKTKSKLLILADTGHWAGQCGGNIRWMFLKVLRRPSLWRYLKEIGSGARTA
jgi:hypothetical protein